MSETNDSNISSLWKELRLLQNKFYEFMGGMNKWTAAMDTTLEAILNQLRGLKIDDVDFDKKFLQLKNEVSHLNERIGGAVDSAAFREHRTVILHRLDDMEGKIIDFQKQIAGIETLKQTKQDNFWKWFKWVIGAVMASGGAAMLLRVAADFMDGGI